jgi:hypothetical protein
MGRKPTRYKKVLDDWPELNWREKTFSDLGDIEDEDEKKKPLAEYKEGEHLLRIWQETFVPASQEDIGTTDEDLNLHHKEVQALLDAEGKGLRLEFFNDRTLDHLRGKYPEEGGYSIIILKDEPKFLQVMSFWGTYPLELRNIKWTSLRPPPEVMELKNTIKEFQKGGDDEQMKTQLARIASLLGELNKYR